MRKLRNREIQSLAQGHDTSRTLLIMWARIKCLSYMPLRTHGIMPAGYTAKGAWDDILKRFYSTPMLYWWLGLCNSLRSKFQNLKAVKQCFIWEIQTILISDPLCLIFFPLWNVHFVPTVMKFYNDVTRCISIFI